MKKTQIALAAALMLAMTACSGDGDATASTATTTVAPTTTSIAAASTEIDVQGFLFNPSEVSVTAGTEVTWTNRDRIDHTVTAGTSEAPIDSFDESLPDAGATASVVFNQPGTFDYFCAIHPHMRGTITVSE